MRSHSRGRLWRHLIQLMRNILFSVNEGSTTAASKMTPLCCRILGLKIKICGEKEVFPAWALPFSGYGTPFSPHFFLHSFLHPSFLPLSLLSADRPDLHWALSCSETSWAVHVKEFGSSLILVWVEETMRGCVFPSFYLVQLIKHVILQLFVLLSAAVSQPNSSTASHCKKICWRVFLSGLISLRNSWTPLQRNMWMSSVSAEAKETPADVCLLCFPLM